MYKIKKDQYEILELKRIAGLKSFVRRNGNENVNYISFYEDDRPKPTIYALLGNGEKITEVLDIVRGSGCGMMVGFSATEMARILNHCAVKNLKFMGIARVGQFHSRATRAFGSARSQLNSLSPDFLLLSMGREGMKLQKVSNARNLKLKVE